MKGKRNQDLKGRVALVTGGARNIGLAVAKELASRGASIAIADLCRDLETIPYKLSRKDDLEESIRTLSSLGVRAHGFICDVRHEDQVQRTVEKVIEAFGRLDILVNNAGVVSLYPLERLSEKAWDEVVDVCLKGTYLCCKHAFPHMVKQKYGKIVNISSVGGLTGLGLSVHYCAAKHGVLGITKALAMEVADHNINVNAICPGTVESVMLTGLATQVDVEGTDPYAHFARGHLFQDRKILPNDIAHAVRWLVSEESRNITGTVLKVDAGWTVGH